MNKRIGMLFTLVLLVSMTTVHADLIAIRSGGGSSSSLFQLDESTGAATLLTNVNGANDLGQIAGLTFLGGELFASDIFGDNNLRTGSINTNTGLFTGISDQDGSINWHSLAADEQAGILYAVESGSNVLKSLTPQGATTTIGSGLGVNMAGLAFDDGNGILYGLGQDRGLYTIDTTLGTKSLVGVAISLSSSGNQNSRGLAYDENTDTLYVSDTNGLFSLNVNNGSATFIGSHNQGFLDGLAFLDTSIPEPSTYFLLFLALGVFTVKKR